MDAYIAAAAIPLQPPRRVSKLDFGENEFYSFVEGDSGFVKALTPGRTT